MTPETEVLTGEAGREVAETAALLLFVGSGIGAVLFFCVFAGGGVTLTALLGVAAMAGVTGGVFCLHRLARHATRADSASVPPGRLFGQPPPTSIDVSANAIRATMPCGDRT
jgi:hypothetical protein